jgi:hypothetical protein
MLVIKCFSGCTNSGRIYRNKHCIFSIEYIHNTRAEVFHIPPISAMGASQLLEFSSRWGSFFGIAATLGNWIDWTGLTELDPLKFAEIWLVSILFVWSSAPIFHLIQCALDVLTGSREGHCIKRKNDLLTSSIYSRQLEIRAATCARPPHPALP